MQFTRALAMRPTRWSDEPLRWMGTMAALSGSRHDRLRERAMETLKPRVNQSDRASDATAVALKMSHIVMSRTYGVKERRDTLFRFRFKLDGPR